ncbi:hypothetical protein ACIQXF_20335 [Lysinibacillus sp. NPDC097231]|uniref:hypothetical protein n=1 Tax=Lysinibacillus sp. NPDC097231 TaxID=3364142 RepID=UPI00380B5554
MRETSTKTAFYLHPAEDSHLYRWRDECGFDSTLVGVQTPAEIVELSLRTPRPVATTE